MVASLASAGVAEAPVTDMALEASLRLCTFEETMFSIFALSPLATRDAPRHLRTDAGWLRSSLVQRWETGACPEYGNRQPPGVRQLTAVSLLSYLRWK